MELLTAMYAINGKSGREAYIKDFVRAYVANMPVCIEEDTVGNLFITKGASRRYPCLVAHLDEVHDNPDRQIIVEGDFISAINSNGDGVGVGADDKNGIWIALRLLQKLPVLKVALFVGEEKLDGQPGCRGSRGCDLSVFDNCAYLLQCDRKGCSDVVTYYEKGQLSLCDDTFPPAHILAKYGYETCSGGRTDVVALRERGLLKNCCNISCGYYRAHTPDEYTRFSHLKNALQFVEEWIAYNESL